MSELTMGAKYKKHNKPKPDLAPLSGLCRRLWQLLSAPRADRPLWTRRVFAIKFVANLSVALLLAWQNDLLGQMASACQEGDYDKFLVAVKWFGIHLIGFFVQRLITTWTHYEIGIKWRRYLTDMYFERYFSHKNFYHANGRKALDNPGVRITDDVETFVENAIYIQNEYQAAIMITFSAYKLWQIDAMCLLIIPYALFAVNFIYLLWASRYSRATTRKFKEVATMRTGLVQTSEYAESVAFLNAENYEYNSAEKRYGLIERTLRLINMYATTAECAYKMLVFTGNAMPYLLLAHRYFAAQDRWSDAGHIVMAAGLMKAIVDVWLTIVDTDNFEKINEVGAAEFRLAELDYELDQMDEQYLANLERRVILKAKQGLVTKDASEAGLAFQNVSLSTPGEHSKRLVQNLDMTVAAGASVVIVGPSGCGKSSLLRAICGLWEVEQGSIRIPTNIDPMFLPQQPYVPDIALDENTLRSQMMFPKGVTDMSDGELVAILKSVNLDHLMEGGLGANSGLDTTSDWRIRLSGGEKQRLAMARLLIARPQMAFLDEATSALDPENERKLYQEMQRRNATYISIGHKEALYKFHKYVLELRTDGSWQFRESKSFQPLAMSG